MPAPAKNKNAAKPAGTTNDANICMRCKEKSKTRWEKVAKKAGAESLSEWVIATLDNAATKAKIPGKV